MMNIVKRLRTQPPIYGECSSTQMLREEAADEIEMAQHRLNKQVERTALREAEIERLQAEVAWLNELPRDFGCDSKCEYGKRRDPAGCTCGRVEWYAKAPAHLRRDVQKESADG